MKHGFDRHRLFSLCHQSFFRVKVNKDFRANIYLRFAFPAKKHQEEKKMSNQCFPQEHYIHYVRGHPYITSAKRWVGKNGNFYWFLVPFMLTEVGGSNKDKKTADVIYGWSLTLFVAWENLAQIASVFHYDAQKMMGIRILNIRLSLYSILIPKWKMLKAKKIPNCYANKQQTINNSVF